MGIPVIGEFIDNALDKLVPDAAERQQLKLRNLELLQAGEFKPLELRFNAIIAEAQSSDKWTSRARPSFMYVVYTYILAGIPMGFLFAFMPEVAEAVVTGVKGWLESIPPGMWAAFTAGYLGYTTNRSKDKAIQLGHEPSSGLMTKLFG